MSKFYSEIMTIKEVVEYLRIPSSTICKLAQEGRIPYQMVGKQWNFLKEAPDQWLVKDSRVTSTNSKKSINDV